MKIQYGASSHQPGRTEQSSHVAIERIDDQEPDIPFLRSRGFWAERLGICEATLARAAKRGDLAFTRIGDRVLHSPEAISAWITQRERKGVRP